MKENHERFKESRKPVRRLMVVVGATVGIIAIVAVYLMVDPDLSAFKSPEPELVEVPPEAVEDDFDKIENGIHVRTGLVEAPGMMETVQNCTSCHSAKLVIANRMNKERWIATIRWMQETQNLWDLGKNEAVIVDYLVTNYPPQEKGRRTNLTDIEWYKLNE